MKTLKWLLPAVLCWNANTVLADDINGTWKFEKAVDYEGLSPNADPPAEYRTIQIVDANIRLSSRCHISLEKMVDQLDVPFQAMFRIADMNTEQIGKYLNKQFGFKMTNVSYRAGIGRDNCNRLGLDILVSKDRLIFVRAGSIFRSFIRSDGEVSAASKTTVPLYGHKLSQLPYIHENFMDLCWSTYPGGKNGPLTTTKCAPVYYPYAVYPKDKDPLSILIGRHHYVAGGAHAEDSDYDDPLSNGLHPVFMLLPPLGDVLLVRVEDMEGRHEQRQTIGGVFLSIKNDKVVDQLNDDCNWDEHYYCSYEGKKPRYRLLESGKFKELK